MNLLVAGRESSMQSISQEMARMIDEMASRRFVTFKADSAWQPAMNVYETGGEYVVCVDLAGVDHKSIDVRANEGVLHVSGKRPTPRPRTDEEISIHLMEIEHGAFCRQIELPGNVVVDRIEATYRQGFLWIRLPKGEGESYAT